MTAAVRRAAAAIVVIIAVGCADRPAQSPDSTEPRGSSPGADRSRAFRRARVWTATNIERINIRAGPPGGFPFLASVPCTYTERRLRGHSLKFACDLGGGDVVKVKVGEHNSEVYGEVAATRLLWALGFGADHMYPVRVRCRGCPASLGGTRNADNEALFDPAAVERELPGAEFKDDPGWSWPDLDLLEPAAGAASRAEIDALKLMAVLLQHTDTKVEQQRLLCVDDVTSRRPEDCRRPFLMINDLGLTFGRASILNDNAVSGANFLSWSSVPVWKDSTGCVGNLAQSLTGTLNDPRISEEGRQFLARLLVRLSTRQIRDLFEVSRFDVRPQSMAAPQASAPIDEWVRVFSEKRDAIVNRRCE
jgi:hypothetical protein